MGRAVPHGFVHSQEEQALIRREVDRLIGNEHFRASKRNKRFLEFVVNETLSGRGERIKAYTIAVDVFGRGMEFDPMLDPIVRIEANRLRIALQAFYEGAGTESALRVCMPKGKYVPTFEGILRREVPTSAPHRSVSTDEPGRPCALVEVTVAEGVRSSDAAHLAYDLTIESLKLCDVRVVVRPCGGRVAARKAFEVFLKEPGSAYAIDITATGSGLFWHVGRLAGGEVISRERLFDVTGGPESLDAIQEITARIAGLVSSAGEAGFDRPFLRHLDVPTSRPS